MKQIEETRSLFAAIGLTVRSILRHRCWPVALALLAVVLVIPSLRAGWVMDDHFLRLTAVGSPRASEMIGSPMDMFRFLDGNPERAGPLMDLGLLPWWTSKEVKVEQVDGVGHLAHDFPIPVSVASRKARRRTSSCEVEVEEEHRIGHLARHLAVAITVTAKEALFEPE